MGGRRRAGRRRLGLRRGLQAGTLLAIAVGVFLVRGHAEQWCPFGGVETAYAYLTEGNALCSAGVSNLFLLLALLSGVLLLRRAFCSHACPVGTLSEWTGGIARRAGLRPRRVPPSVDRVLSLLKYGVLALVLAFTWSLGELWFRGTCPAYALLGRHGEDIRVWAYALLGALLVGSFVVSLPFCRWLCPLAAVMNPLSRLGLFRVRRDSDGCADCGKCSRACPMAIPVGSAKAVTHARCTLCLACVEACPPRTRRALRLGLVGRAGAPAWAVAPLLLLVLGAGVLAAVLLPLPSFRWHRDGASPARLASVDLQVSALTCRGRANLLVYFLDRDDDLALPGYVGVEVWPRPEPEAGRARVSYDPRLTDADAIQAALTSAYIDTSAAVARPSPFRIAGYDPLGLSGGPAGP